MEAGNEPTRVWNRRFIHLFSIEVFSQIGLYTMRPILSNYAIFLGAAVATAGVISGLAMIVAMVLRPASGVISDIVDKKISLALSATMFAVGAAGCAFSQSVEMMTFFVALQGFGYGFKSISMTSLVAMVSPKEHVGAAVGWVGLINTLAMAVGPAFGAFLAENFSFPTSFGCAAVLTSIAALLAIAFKSPDSGVRERRATLRSRPKGSLTLGTFAKNLFYLPSVPLAVITVTLATSHGAMSSLVLTIEDTGYLQAGEIYFIAYALVAVLARPLFGRLTDRFGMVAVGLPAMCIAAVGMGSLAFFHSAAAVVFCGVCMGAGQASAQSALQAESVRGVPLEYLGRATNTYYFGPDIGAGFGPAVCGAILQSFGGQAMFVTCSALIVAGMLFMFAMRSRFWRPGAKRARAQA